MAHALHQTRVSRTRRAGLIPLVSNAFSVWRQRRSLHGLDAHMRRDIGLTDSEICTETTRPLWDVPQNWRL